jgi:hypothetical protein
VSGVAYPRVFAEPTPLGQAQAFVAAVRGADNCVLTNPGPSLPMTPASWSG